MLPVAVRVGWEHAECPIGNGGGVRTGTGRACRRGRTGGATGGPLLPQVGGLQASGVDRADDPGQRGQGVVSVQVHQDDPAGTDRWG